MEQLADELKVQRMNYDHPAETLFDWLLFALHSSDFQRSP